VPFFRFPSALFLLAALCGCGLRLSEPEPLNLSFQVQGEPAPRSLGDFRGRVVAFTLWEPSCPQCDAQALVLNDLNARLSREGLICFVLHEQGAPEPAASLNLITGTVVSAPAGRLSRARPVTLILDRQGRLVHQIEKPAGAQELERLLAPLLAG
jgi:thiol-disulfide isomerase/thioredoxin